MADENDRRLRENELGQTIQVSSTEHTRQMSKTYFVRDREAGSSFFCQVTGDPRLSAQHVAAFQCAVAPRGWIEGD